MWAGNPWAWGLGAWAAGSLWYNTGYAVYANPYYVPNQTVVVVESPALDYSQPINVSEGSAQANSEDDQTVSDEGMAKFESARSDFMVGDYQGALANVEAALVTMPNDAVLHEFRALALFALGRYQEAAATLYAVLTVGPGWDWTTMNALYPSMSVYTEQLRALEQYQREHPNSAEPHFVLAYHYLTAGHTEETAEQLEKVIEIQPGDQLSAQLLEMLSPKETPTVAAPVAPTTPQSEVEPESLIGTWKAAPAAGASIELVLKDDGTFTWTATGGNADNQLSGTYEVAGNVLVLQLSNGSALVGNVTPKGDQGFGFKMIGGPPDDQGLQFGRS